MDAAEIKEIRDLMDYEKARKGPPDGYPAFPDMPAGRYNSQEFFDLEKEHYWSKVWMLAGHMDEIPDIGCYKLWELSGQPVVIVHGEDGKAHAFFNTCSHRGAPVVKDAFGQAPGGLACGYHGWTYNYEGELVSIRDKRDFVDLDMSCRSLLPVKVEQYGKLIFVNFDQDAGSLKDYLGPVSDQWEEFGFDKIRLADHYVWDLKSNWKIAMEANMEVYHVKSIHPETVDTRLDYRANLNTLYNRGHSRMVAPSHLPVEEAMELSLSSPMPLIDTVGEIGHTCTQAYHVAPNFVSPMAPIGFPILQFWPTSLGECKYEIWWVGADWGEGERPAMWDDLISGFNVIITEDTQFGDWIQKSVESYAFSGVPLCYQESRIYHMHESIDRTIGINRIPEDLRVAQVIGDEWSYPNDNQERLRQHRQVAAE